ncbi:MAG: hypothetical protein ACSHX7_07050 [Luteolibacter sp.]
MKSLPEKIALILLPAVAVSIVSCEQKSSEDPEAAESKAAPGNEPEVENEVLERLRNADMPMLPIKKGDFWKYSFRVEVTAGVTSESAASMDVEQELLRTYMGKVHVADGLPQTDAFDVEIKGMPTQRELVEIHPDRIMMRGTITPQMLDAKPMWLNPPVVFVYAGMRPGQDAVKLEAGDGDRTRALKVVAREEVKTPAGDYNAIRLLMTGKDGEFEIRKTTWFAPQIGIVKEEKTRYAGEKLLFRETTELVETNVKVGN